MSSFIDEARPVRAGEELDLAKLTPYLQEQLRMPGAAVSVAQFPGGHSNLTYLVNVGDKEFALRRPPFGSKVKTAHDMGREVRVLSRLAANYSRVPRPILFCEDESIVGAKFYLMERVRGLILRRELPAGLTIEPSTAERLCFQFVDALVELHAIDWRAAGLTDFGKPDGYVARQVSGWSKRYVDSQTDEIPEMDSVGKWLAANLPPSQPPTIIHNDFKFDNLILAPDDMTQIIAILDWEMATIGDPLMDLGTALCYWVEAGDSEAMRMFRFGPTVLPGMYTRQRVADEYARRSGRDIAHLNFYYAFGLFKTAVVAQQIYFRFKQGHTKDERFAAFIFAVRVLAAQAGAAVA